MILFSQRAGYTPVDRVFVRNTITEELKNAICNCFDDFKSIIVDSYSPEEYVKLYHFLWRYYLNRRMSEFDTRKVPCRVLEYVLLNDTYSWYNKLDIVELSLRFLFAEYSDDRYLTNKVVELVNSLNFEFRRLNFAYRIIDKQIIEVSSEEEINEINKALLENKDSIREHLSKAIEHCSKRPKGDYRNSIKESISAVEVLCRKRTGENTLGHALKKLKNNGVIIPPKLESAFIKLYDYTNNENTGIRHGLMDDEGTYTPGSDEAIFMLVSCSAFINYLNKK